jgi:hypothetical protein
MYFGEAMPHALRPWYQHNTSQITENVMKTSDAGKDSGVISIATPFNT